MDTAEPANTPAMAGATATADQAAARYSSGAIVLHWVIALALAFQLALGFAMPNGPSGFALVQLHKSVGIAILVLTLVRVAWRFTHTSPPAVEGGLGGLLAKAVHVLLYVFMLGGPLTGWALVSTSKIVVPTMVFGVLPWPHLPLPGGIHEAMEEAHELIAWIGIALFLLHVAGALRHQFMLKDGLMRRMAPGGSVALTGLLGLAVVATYFGSGMTIAGKVAAEGGYGPPPGEETPAAAPSAAPTAEATATPTEEATAEASETPAATESEIAGPPPSWAVQPGGRLGFSVDNGGEAIRGTFSDWSGTIRFDPDKPDNAPDIRIAVKLASASLGDATMDGMLQGGDFFGTSANPAATFRSTSVRQTGPGRYVASGTLNLKGVSRPQSISFTLSGSGLKRKVDGSGTISRSAFGVGSGDSAANLGSTVALSFSFDAVGK